MHEHQVQSEKTTHRDEFGTRIVQTCACGYIRVREIMTSAHPEATNRYGFTVRDAAWQSPTPSADSDS